VTKPLLLVLALGVGCVEFEAEIGHNAPGTPDAGGGGEPVVDPGEPPAFTILADGPMEAFDIAVDETFVYWVVCNQDADFSRIYRVPKAGGSYETVASYPLRIYQIAVDGTHVYAAIWGNDAHEGSGKLGRVAKAGGSMEILIDAISYPYLVVVEGDWVYTSPYTAAGEYGDMYELWRIPKAGGPIEQVVPEVRGPFYLAFDETHLYMTDSDSQLLRAPRAGGPAVDILPDEDIGGVVLDAENVYFQNRFRDYCGGTHVYAAPKAGGPLRDLGPAPTCASDMILAGSAVVMASRETGNIVAFPTDGSGPVPLVVDRPGPEALAADASHIYWVDFDSGEVGRVPYDGESGTPL
jgi:hypothetical protein